MGFSICIRHINCRVGLPHKISMYWNKLLMYQNMNTYIHFWNFKRNHPFFLSFFSVVSIPLEMVQFSCVCVFFFFQSVNENYVTSVSPKIPNQIKCSRAFLVILLGNNTTSHQGKSNLEDPEEGYFRVAFKKHDMEGQLYVVVGSRDAHSTFICITLYFSSVKRRPKLVKL